MAKEKREKRKYNININIIYIIYNIRKRKRKRKQSSGECIFNNILRINVSRLFIIACAHKSFYFPLVCNYTKQQGKHGSGLLNSVLGNILFCLYITRVCMYLYSYTKVRVKMFKLKSI